MFSQDTLQYFSDLAENNHRDWFEHNRKRYEKSVLQPARDFVLEMGQRLKKIAPNLRAVPRVDHSIFRIHRDVRFSKDKSPYKTFLGMFFWDDRLKKLESPGFYLHVEPVQLMLGCGVYNLAGDALTRFRDALVDQEMGERFRQIVDELPPQVTLGRSHYKRVPKGYDPDHPNARYLLFNGCYSSWEIDIPEHFIKEDFVDFAFEHFRAVSPLHRWLVDVLCETQ